MSRFCHLALIILQRLQPHHLYMATSPSWPASSPNTVVTPDAPADQTRQQIAALRLMLELMGRKARLYGGRIGAGHLLNAASVRFQWSADDLIEVPPLGPVLIAAGNSCGVEEALLLAALLPEARADVKIVANYLIAGIPELASMFIPLDPWTTRRAAATNRRAVGSALNWLRAGHVLAVFPAGDRIPGAVPRPEARNGGWSTLIPRLVRRTGAAVVPVHFCTSPFTGPGFPLRHSYMEVRGGRPIHAGTVTAIPTDEDAADYLRRRTLSLRARRETPPWGTGHPHGNSTTTV